METKAFILVETAVGKTREVARALKSVEGIKTVDIVTGPFDIIAMMEARDIASIGDVVTGKVHTIPGVGRTQTCVAVVSV